MPTGVYKRRPKTCSLCDSQYFAKGLCKNHYEKIRRKKYPDRYRKASKKWTEKNKEKIREYKRKYMKIYSKKNPGLPSIVKMHKVRFGGLREQIIKRDEEKCVECSMSRQEHRNRFGRDITVDHYDGQGRYSDEPNNEINNLQTLCLPCHGHKDVKRRTINPVKERCLE